MREREQRIVRTATRVLLGAGIAARLAAAWLDRGVFWPDEIYQTLEQGHRLAFGYGFVPWEFQDGVRSWVLPGLIAGVFKGASLAGVHDSLVLVALAKTLMAAISVAGLVAAVRLAERLAGATAGAIAAALTGFLPALLVFSSRALFEVAAAPLVVASALWLVPVAREARWRSIAAGAAAGLALVLRVQTAMIPAVFLGALFVRARRGDALRFALGAAASVAIFAGVLDWATWGAPFHAITAYLGFHARTGGAEYGGEAATFYLWRLATSSPIGAAALVAGAIAGARRAPALAVAAALFLAAHMAIPHKELRYLVPVLPLWCALAAAGLAALVDAAPRGAIAATAGAVAVAALLGVSTWSDTFADYGQYAADWRGSRRPWNFEATINLLLRDAGRREDLCGLADLAGESLIFNGGYTWLHRDVLVLPLQDHPGRLVTPLVSEAVNYAIAPAGTRAAGWAPVASRGGGVLLRRDGACVPHPELDAREMPHPESTP